MEQHCIIHISRNRACLKKKKNLNKTSDIFHTPTSANPPAINELNGRFFHYH